MGGYRVLVQERQLAEAQALYERRGGEARSAGSQPGAELHPVVVEAMAEIGVDISDRRPKGFTREDVEWADYVITMGCGDACPYIPRKEYIDWDLADPAKMSLDDVRELRAVIEEKVSRLPI